MKGHIIKDWFHRWST